MLAWEPMWIIMDLSKPLKHHFGPQRRQRQEAIMEQALGKAKKSTTCHEHRDSQARQMYTANSMESMQRHDASDDDGKELQSQLSSLPRVKKIWSKRKKAEGNAPRLLRPYSDSGHSANSR